MDRRHRHKRRILPKRRERKLLIATLIVYMFLGMALTFATGRFSAWRKNAIESFLMQYIPKDMEREEFLKKAKNALGGSEAP